MRQQNSPIKSGTQEINNLNLLGPTQLLSTYHRRKPFQIKQSTGKLLSGGTNVIGQHAQQAQQQQELQQKQPQPQQLYHQNKDAQYNQKPLVTLSSSVGGAPGVSCFHSQQNGAGSLKFKNSISAASQGSQLQQQQQQQQHCFAREPTLAAYQTEQKLVPGGRQSRNSQQQKTTVNKLTAAHHPGLGAAFATSTLAHQDSSDNIIVKGVKKGIQPQFGWNLASQVSISNPQKRQQPQQKNGGTFTEELVQQGLLEILPLWSKTGYNQSQPPSIAASAAFLRTSGATSQLRQQSKKQQEQSQLTTNTLNEKPGSTIIGQKSTMLQQQGPSQRHLNNLLMYQHPQTMVQSNSIRNGSQIDPYSYLTVSKTNASIPLQKDIKDLRNTLITGNQKILTTEQHLMQQISVQKTHKSKQSTGSTLMAFSNTKRKDLKNNDRQRSQSREQTDTGKSKLLQQFVKQQVAAQQQVDRQLKQESLAIVEYQRLMQREIDKLKVQVPAEENLKTYNNKPNVILSPIQNNHNSLRFSNNTKQSNPLSIQTCEIQKSQVNQICLDCQGLILVDGQKRASFSENFLICQCTTTNEYQGSPLLPQKSNAQMLQTMQGQRCLSLEKARESAQQQRNENFELPQYDSLDQPSEIQFRMFHPQQSKQMLFSNNGGASTNQQCQPGVKDLKYFIKKQVVKFYQNNLVHEPIKQKGMECKGQTFGELMLTKPLGTTLQEARKQQAFDRDHARRTGIQQQISQIKDNANSPPHNMNNINLINVQNVDDYARSVMIQNDRSLKSKGKVTNHGQNGMTNRSVKNNMRNSINDEQDFTISDVRRQELSDINTFFKQINEFVRVTLKFKETITQAHLAQIRRLGRQIGLKFGCVKELDAKFINSKDFVAILKSKIFCMLNAMVMKTSSLSDVHQSMSQKTYKFYVEPSGNNHTLVRSVIKRRSWFSSQELSSENGWSGPGPKLLNLIWTQVRRPRVLRELQPYQIYNHLDGINEISQKSNLFLNMRSYYQSREKNVFDYMPETYLIPCQASFELNAQFKAFRAACQPGQLWIFKPGESTNRGNGIKVFNDFDKIKAHMVEYCRMAENKRGQGRFRNCILQKYIKRPLLIHKRKFDIRVFALAVCHADTGRIRGYFYDEGYLRTSSKDFNIDKWDNRLIHLTNDAVQKHSADYGKYESANKISYCDFDKHLIRERGVSFLRTTVPKIKEIVTDVFEASGRAMYRPNEKSEGVSRGQNAINYNGFELMGFDFMLDAELNLVLIEVNTNPCLDTPCMLLQRMIPQVLDQTLKIAVDPFLQASEHQYYMTQDLNVAEMRFQLVYQDSMELAKIDQKGDYQVQKSSSVNSNNKIKTKPQLCIEDNKDNNIGSEITVADKLSVTNNSNNKAEDGVNESKKNLTTITGLIAEPKLRQIKINEQNEESILKSTPPEFFTQQEQKKQHQIVQLRQEKSQSAQIQKNQSLKLIVSCGSAADPSLI